MTDIVRELRRINAQVGDVILRMNRARRDEIEVCIAAKPIREVAKRDSAISSLPSLTSARKMS
jgi:hypothetical protein